MNAHSGKQATRFDNWSNEVLADEIGMVDSNAKAAAKRLEELKAEAKRRGIESASGERWRITIDAVSTNRLDTKALRELLGDALDPYYKSTTSATLRISSLFQQPEVVG